MMNKKFDATKEPVSEELKTKINQFIDKNTASILNTKELINDLMNLSHKDTKGQEEVFQMLTNQLNQVHFKLDQINKLLVVFRNNEPIPIETRNFVY